MRKLKASPRFAGRSRVLAGLMHKEPSREDGTPTERKHGERRELHMTRRARETGGGKDSHKVRPLELILRGAALLFHV